MLSGDNFDFKINGYIYNLPVIQKYPEAYSELTNAKSDEDYIYSNITKVRIRPSLYIGNNTEINAHYEINSMISNISVPLSFGDDISNRQAVDLKTQPFSNDNVMINHFIDRLYVKQFFDFGEITAGRQRVSWGVGRIWQITDLFNPINPANFTQFEKEGADALSGKIYTGNFSDLEMVINFRQSFNDYNYGFRYRTNFSEFDFGAIGGYFDNRYVTGLEIAGNFFDAGVRSEILLSADESDIKSNYYKLLLGIDYQFTDKLYGLLEYKHNGQGTECKLCYDLEKLFKGEMQNAGLDYFASQITYQFHPLLSGNLMLITNLRDNSGFLSSGLNYNIFQNFNLGLSGIFFYGSERSEYWYYSTSGLINIEWYF